MSSHRPPEGPPEWRAAPRPSATTKRRLQRRERPPRMCLSRARGRALARAQPAVEERELRHEARVRLRVGLLDLVERERLLEAPAVLGEEVRYAARDAARDAVEVVHR